MHVLFLTQKPSSIANEKIWLFPEFLLVGIEAHMQKKLILLTNFMTAVSEIDSDFFFRIL